MPRDGSLVHSGTKHDDDDVARNYASDMIVRIPPPPRWRYLNTLIPHATFLCRFPTSSIVAKLSVLESRVAIVMSRRMQSLWNLV